MRKTVTFTLYTAFILFVIVPSLFAQGKSNPHGAINLPCETCHSPASWGDMSPAKKFDHNTVGFPITGRHRTASCRECHPTLVFASAGNTCRDCHSDIHSGQFGSDCADCHSPEMWMDYQSFRVRHEETRFSLVGPHSQLDCQACHKGQKYINLPTECSGCHLLDFTQTTDPAHPNVGFSQNCTDCHSPASFQWKGATFTHTADFPLQGGHDVGECGVCHSTPGQILSTECVACHQSDYNSAQSPSHTASHFSQQCTDCHNNLSWTPSTFNHNQTTYPLEGAHQSLACEACHSSGQFAGLPAQCFDCHSADYQGVVSPNHSAAQFSSNCLDCHDNIHWTPSTFNHQNTNYPLSGAHVNAACELCHQNGVFAGTPNDCWSCHQTDYNGVVNPNHSIGQFSQDCMGCHTTDVWTPSTFNHNQTMFPLIGMHQPVSCEQCHISGQFQGTPSDCWSCHQSDYNRTLSPNHPAAQINHDCTQCHNEQGWTPSSFNHNNTNYPLQGAHQTAECQECHLNGVFAGTPTQCWSCHQNDYNGASDPNHAAGQFNHDCTQCHSMNGWEPSTFDHNITSFPLTGQHTTITCEECHINGVYPGTPTDCWSCHQPDYMSAQNPNHNAAQIDHDCTQCHTTQGWTPSTFDHDNTAFPLIGAHRYIVCQECHLNGVFAGTPSDCWSCHQNDYNNVTNPNHVTGMFNHNCLICHTEMAWVPSTLNHNQTTFPLTGAHMAVACEECHIDGQYSGTPTDCWSCHEEDYNGVTDPNHIAGQFNQDCTICHTTQTWSPSTFNHNNTPFPLTGAHTSVACQLCHIDGQYSGTPSDCWSCHQSDYNGATNPNHVAGQFSQNCTICHTTTAWSPSTFNHNNTPFPLTGAHTTVACQLCHIDGQYSGTPTDCWSCHEEDYNGVTNPNHVAGQFSQNCTICHTTTAWSPSTFNHNNTPFPLTGAHTTVACQLCHINGQYSGTPTDCWSCHEEDYNGVTNPVHTPGQFSQICTQCHTTTAWSPSTFNHNSTGWPLTGAHRSTACSECHIAGQYSGTPEDCYFCHQVDYNNATNPNHRSLGYPFSCEDCHNTSNWDSQFNHQPYFPIYSGPHNQENWDTCLDCHPNPNNFAVFTCLTCHSQGEMNDEHDEVPGYQYNSQACLNCHPDGEEDSPGSRGRNLPKKHKPEK